MALCFLMAIVIYFTYPVSSLEPSVGAGLNLSIGICWENTRGNGFLIFEGSDTLGIQG